MLIGKKAGEKIFADENIIDTEDTVAEKLRLCVLQDKRRILGQFRRVTYRNHQSHPTGRVKLRGADKAPSLLRT